MEMRGKLSSVESRDEGEAEGALGRGGSLKLVELVERDSENQDFCK